MAVSLRWDISPQQGQAQGRGFGLGEERRPHLCEIHHLARTPPQAGVEIQEAGRLLGEWAGGGTGHAGL